jgi:hypothetical protein
MKTTIKPLLLTLLLLSCSLIFGQVDPFNPDDPGSDPGLPVPIDDYIFPMILAALIFGYRIVLKKKKIY